jgi:hypothetical protein
MAVMVIFISFSVLLIALRLIGYSTTLAIYKLGFFSTLCFKKMRNYIQLNTLRFDLFFVAGVEDNILKELTVKNWEPGKLIFNTCDKFKTIPAAGVLSKLYLLKSNSSTSMQSYMASSLELKHMFAWSQVLVSQNNQSKSGI